MTIAVRIFPPMPSRSCRFCLSLQDDSVFADFDVDDRGLVFLRRISFDGYGCCDVPETIKRMSNADSLALVEAHDRGEVGGREITTVLRAYFLDNIDVIWSDALIHHGLIFGGNDGEPIDDSN
jgi:hypothetical protein